jgi:hypothetical protein
MSPAWIDRFLAVGPAGFSAFGTIDDDAAFDVVLVAAT